MVKNLKTIIGTGVLAMSIASGVVSGICFRNANHTARVSEGLRKELANMPKPTNVQETVAWYDKKYEYLRVSALGSSLSLMGYGNAVYSLGQLIFGIGAFAMARKEKKNAKQLE